jgi:hypothetical protein
MKMMEWVIVEQPKFHSLLKKKTPPNLKFGRGADLISFELQANNLKCRHLGVEVSFADLKTIKTTLQVCFKLQDSGSEQQTENVNKKMLAEL